METAGQIVPLGQFVALAKSQLRIDHTTEHDIYLNTIAQQGIRHLDSLSLLKKNMCPFDICENKIKLPCGFYKVIGLRFGSGEFCQSTIFADFNFLKGCECDSAILLSGTNSPIYKNYIGTFEIIPDNFIWFHNLPEGITTATIAYQSFRSDKDGFLLEQTDHERALVGYICWKFTLKYFMDYPQYIQNQYQQEWIAQKKWVKSTDWNKQFHDYKNQVREWANALVCDKSLWTA